MPTKIEWAEDTVNPAVGCDKISPGCRGCYAERMAKRLIGKGHKKYLGVVDKRGWTGKIGFDISAMDKCIKNKKPTVYFVCSMGDLFHDTVLDNWIIAVMKVIHKCPQHTFLILTKRPDRMKTFFDGIDKLIPGYFPLKNVWLGVTAENQEQAEKRIPTLLQIPAAKRFVSIEPMLGPIDLQKRIIVTGAGMKIYNSFSWIERLDWVICGGESGPGARPMHPDWVRSIRDQCQEANVPFTFKQWGEWHETDLDPNPPKKRHLWPGGKLMARYGKKKAGRELDGKIWEERP